MPAGASSFHKKLVFGSAGCAVLLVLFMVFGWLTYQQSGVEKPPQQRLFSPAMAAVALDSLARLDLVSGIDAPLSVEDLRCRETDPTRHVAPRTSRDSVAIPVSFGDTFPPGSPARRLWTRLGSLVVLDRGPPDVADLDSLPPGRWLLAGVRVQLDRGDGRAACVMLGAALDKAERLAGDQELRLQAFGVELARDVADMISRDAQLRTASGLTGAPAAEQVSTLDRRARAMRDLERLIDAAGTAPASVDTLASWAEDSTLPLSVRDAFVRAIGYGWIDDPREMSFGVDRARRNAIARLSDHGVPERLQRTARVANDILQAGLVERFQFSVGYQARRFVAP